MTEQLKHSTIDQYSYPTETDNDKKDKIRLNRKGRLVRAGGIVLAAATLTGTAAVGVGEIFHEETIASDYETVGKGSNATETVLNSLEDMAKSKGIDPNAVRGVVQTANEMGNVVHEGDEYLFTLNENGVDQLSIHVEKVDSSHTDPANLAHLDD